MAIHRSIRVNFGLDSAKSGGKSEDPSPIERMNKSNRAGLGTG